MGIQTDVSIFCLFFFFNAFWKFLWLGNSAWDFFGVKFCPGIFGVVLFEAQGIFLGFDFCPHSIIPVEYPHGVLVQ